MSQKFRSLNDPWPWPRKIGVRVHYIHTVIAHCRYIGPMRVGKKLSRLISSLLQAKTARHNDHDLRSPLENVIPMYANGIGPLTGEFVDTACNADHFWHPMTTTVDGIDPFHAKHSRAG